MSGDLRARIEVSVAAACDDDLGMAVAAEIDTAPADADPRTTAMDVLRAVLADPGPGGTDSLAHLVPVDESEDDYGVSPTPVTPGPADTDSHDDEPGWYADGDGAPWPAAAQGPGFAAATLRAVLVLHSEDERCLCAECQVGYWPCKTVRIVIDAEPVPSGQVDEPPGDGLLRARIEAIHKQDTFLDVPCCSTCRDPDWPAERPAMWPCPTRAALEGTT